nr:alpha/beta hydrolase fold domain-containing protein [Prevotella sp.]
MKKISLFFVLLLGAGSLFAQSTSRTFQFYNSTDKQSVVYAYLPENPSGRAVVDCPGGGYAHLAMDYEGHQWAEFFNKKGIAYFVLKYRMPNGDKNIPLSDAYNAMKTVRDSASAWHVNPNDVGIMGFSAGGHLASSVSTHAKWEERPDFSILFYPVVSMNESDSHKGSCVNFLGKEGQADKEMVKNWSNFNAVRPHLTPRAVVLLANDDAVVPPITNGVAYYSAMRKVGNECSMYIYPTGGHGFGFRDTWAFHNQMLNDLSTWLDSFKASNANAVRVACIGNSITDGFGIDMAEANGYPAQLQKKLGDDYLVKNFGVSSRTLLNKGDYPYMNEPAWKDALGFNPNIVIVKLGTNDSKPYVWKYKDEFITDYKQLIDSLKALPSKPKIYICTPIPGQNEGWGITDKVITEEVIPMIQKVAKKNKVQLIDLHSLFVNTDGKKMQRDGVHPTKAGAGELADLILKTIKK